MRANEQEPDMSPTVAGERAKDREAHVHQATGGKSGDSASKGVELTSAKSGSRLGYWRHSKAERQRNKSGKGDRRPKR